MQPDEAVTRDLPARKAESETLQLPGSTTSPSDSQPLPVHIGRFQIRAKLGEGAFGEVFRAYDPQLDREVAVKVAKPSALDTPEKVQRFLREAKAAANLRHPNIVPLHETGTDAGRPFIVSAFIAGQTLEELIETAVTQKARLSAERSARIVRQLAEGLAHAHECGIVHRDVKPANVVLDGRDQPMLMDFGLAARHEGNERLTHAGTIMGTPLYMAPEQILGHEAGVIAASDQYSLGVVLFEMITGQPPFSGTPELVMFLHVEREPPRPIRVRPTLSRDLEKICLKCLAKMPKDRYTTIRDLADDLGRFLDGKPVLARPLSYWKRLARRVRKHPVQSALFLLTLPVALLGMYAILSGGRVEPPTIVKEIVQVPDDRPPRVGVAQIISRQFTYDEFVGEIVASQSLEVRTRSIAKISKVAFKDGQIVKAGDLLFELDSTIIEAGLKTIRARLELLNTRESEAVSELARTCKGFEVGLATAKDVQTIEVELATIKESLLAIKPELAAKQKELELCTIRSPFEGQVGRCFFSEGDEVKPSDVLASVFSNDIYIKFDVEADRLKKCEVTKEFSFRMANDRTDKRPFLGRIDFINTLPDSNDRFQFRAAISSPDRTERATLYPGMGVVARFPTQPYDAFLVQEIAIIPEGDRRFVRMINSSNIVLQQEVRLGIFDHDSMRVVMPVRGERLSTKDWVVYDGIERALINYPVDPVKGLWPIVANPPPEF